MGLKLPAIADLVACTTNTAGVEQLHHVDNVLIDGSELSHLHASQNLQSGRAIAQSIFNSRAKPYMDKDNRTIIFMFDDASKHPPARRRFLKNTRYAPVDANKVVNPATHVVVNERVYKKGTEPITADFQYVQVTDDRVFPDLARIINTRDARAYGVYMAYVVDAIVKFNDHALAIMNNIKFYVRTPTIIDPSTGKCLPLCDGQYHTRQSNPPIVGFNYGEVDQESHFLANKLEGDTIIYSNDYDHVLLSLNTPCSKGKYIVRNMKTTAGRCVITYISVANLHMIIPAEQRASFSFAVILTGTDTSKTVGISPTGTNKHAKTCSCVTVNKAHTQFKLNISSLFKYIRKVLMTTGSSAKAYTTAAHLERHYITEPFWTLMYMHGVVAPEALLGPETLQPATVRLPAEGIVSCADFWARCLGCKATLVYETPTDDDTDMPDVADTTQSAAVAHS